MPTTLLVIASATYGLLLGSFLNVVIARVPQGRSVVRPRSACPRCGTPVAGRDNVPVLSWVLLRGRARCCGEPIAVRYPLVELGTGVAFAALAAWQGFSWLLPALLYLAAVSIALTVIDVDHKRLPNALTLPSYPIGAALLAVAAVGEGDPGRLVRVAICGAALYAFYFLLLMVQPGAMGFGDVKLAGVLGMYLGYLGWASTAVGAFLAFLLGGVVGVALMATGKATRKSQIPFGPYMIVGTWVALVVGEPIGDWYLSAMGF